MSTDSAEVRAALREARRAAEKARTWTERRNEALTAAVAAGATMREAGEACGLSHVGVWKIVNAET